VTEAAVSIDGLVKRYGSRTILDGVSIGVARGEIVALLGPNGAGKTTTVEIVEGYRRGDAGVVRVLGEDPASGGRALRARVGLMLQGGGIDMRARPRETLIQYGRFHADPRDADELLELVGLTGPLATTRYRRLSGGEKQRLGLALALVGKPEVVILDEPTAGMDPEARATTRRIITGLRDDGAAVLLTSHDLTDVERLADRIAVLAGGRIVASGSAAELTSGVRPAVRFRLDGPLTDTEAAALGHAAGGRVVDSGDGGYRLEERAPSPDAVAAVAAWSAANGRMLADVRTVGGSLEEAYLALVGADAVGAAAGATLADSGDSTRTAS
jgi:ABC-2 type transport system ATP-binding protein